MKYGDWQCSGVRRSRVQIATALMGPASVSIDSTEERRGACANMKSLCSCGWPTGLSEHQGDATVWLWVGSGVSKVLGTRKSSFGAISGPY